MWQGKSKALTFSFDDGVTQDRRLVEMFNKYGLKCTFNLNSSLFGIPDELDRNGRRINYTMVEPDEVRELYSGHEIAAHTLTHVAPFRVSDKTIIYQVEEDRLALSKIAGYEVLGMAYPFGHYNEHIADVIKENTGVKYSRTVTSTFNFELPENPYILDPSVHFTEIDEMFRLGREFLEMKCEKPQLFYIWGHSYEMDAEYISWKKFEEFCSMISGHDDIFYGTNKDVLL